MWTLVPYTVFPFVSTARPSCLSHTRPHPHQKKTTKPPHPIREHGAACPPPPPPLAATNPYPVQRPLSPLCFVLPSLHSQSLYNNTTKNNTRHNSPPTFFLCLIPLPSPALSLSLPPSALSQSISFPAHSLQSPEGFWSRQKKNVMVVIFLFFFQDYATKVQTQGWGGNREDRGTLEGCVCVVCAREESGVCGDEPFLLLLLPFSLSFPFMSMSGNGVLKILRKYTYRC